MITAFFAVLPKVPFVVFLLKFLNDVVGAPFFFANLSLVNYALLFTGIASIFFGVFGALYQTRIKRLIAFSSIANVGYILTALSSGTLILFRLHFFM